MESSNDAFAKRDIFGRIALVCSAITALAFFIVLISLFNLIQFFTGAQIGIEHKLLVPEVYSATLMSPISDAFFLLDCSAMILLLLGHPHRVAGLSGGLSFIVISVNLVILLGYLYGAPLLYEGR